MNKSLLVIAGLLTLFWGLFYLIKVLKQYRINFKKKDNEPTLFRFVNDFFLLGGKGSEALMSSIGASVAGGLICGGLLALPVL